MSVDTPASAYLGESPKQPAILGPAGKFLSGMVHPREEKRPILAMEVSCDHLGREFWSSRGLEHGLHGAYWL